MRRNPHKFITRDPILNVADNICYAIQDPEHYFLFVKPRYNAATLQLAFEVMTKADRLAFTKSLTEYTEGLKGGN